MVLVLQKKDMKDAVSIKNSGEVFDLKLEISTRPVCLHMILSTLYTTLLHNLINH